MKLSRMELTALSLFAFAGCDPNDPGSASLAVHTGSEWTAMHDGATVVVLRDNPPLTGIVAPRPGGAVEQTATGALLRQPYVWDRVDFTFDRSTGSTFQDGRNPEGELGVAPVGPVADPGPLLMRWHSNGLQLLPGGTARVHLAQRVFQGAPNQGQWVWQGIRGTDGSVRLDPATRIVGVRVIRVTEPDGPQPRVDRSVAQMWLDGRTIDRTSVSLSSDGNLNAFLVDHDPRTSLAPSPGADTDPGDGRRGPIEVQEPDPVWSVCGERYGENIQFRLVGYDEVFSDMVPGCDHAATMPDSTTPYCVASWGHIGVSDGAPPAIPVAIVSTYQGAGVAETWPGEGIIFGEDDVFDNIGALNPQNTLAHELGHYLGGSDPEFFDGADGPNNLMADHSRNLTQHQCDVAYTTAAAYPAPVAVSTLDPFTPTADMPGVEGDAFLDHASGPNCGGSFNDYGPWQVCPNGSHIATVSCQTAPGSHGSCSVTGRTATGAGLHVVAFNDCLNGAQAHLVTTCMPG